MNINAKDLQALKVPLIVLAIVVLSGGAAVYYGNQGVIKATQGLRNQEAQLREARTRLQRSDEEKDIIVRYLGRYRQLQAQGLVGAEQRINWLDGLRSSNQQGELFGASYQISQQQSYPFAAELNPGKLQIRQSVMKLSIRLLHEGDLMHFFQLLDQQRVGVFSITQCVLDREGGDRGRVLAFQPYLRADCDLAWITIDAESAEKKS